MGTRISNLSKKKLRPILGIGLLIVCLYTQPRSAIGQKDSLVFKNGNTMVGEVKTLTNGVLTVETPYSKNDFTIKWVEVSKLFSQTRFLITLRNGDRMNGTIATFPDSGRVTVTLEDKTTVDTRLNDIVFIKGVKSDFWSRVKASIDVGFNITRANNLKQFSVRSGLGYLADRWQLDATINNINSTQDSIAPTKRTDAAINYKYFLQSDWYLASSVGFLSNTEQALKLRTTAKAGGGKMLLHGNRRYWGLGGGLSFNNENFSNGTPSRKSFEAYVGSELNLFDIGDLSLLTNWYIYPSLTESGRWRSDFQFDAKYEFLADFYLKAGTTINYDNRPAVVGKEIDYVIQFTIGWEL